MPEDWDLEADPGCQGSRVGSVLLIIFVIIVIIILTAILITYICVNSYTPSDPPHTSWLWRIFSSRPRNTPRLSGNGGQKFIPVPPAPQLSRNIPRNIPQNGGNRRPAPMNNPGFTAPLVNVQQQNQPVPEIVFPAVTPLNPLPIENSREILQSQPLQNSEEGSVNPLERENGEIIYPISQINNHHFSTELVMLGKLYKTENGDCILANNHSAIGWKLINYTKIPLTLRIIDIHDTDDCGGVPQVYDVASLGGKQEVYWNNIYSYENGTYYYPTLYKACMIQLSNNGNVLYSYNLPVDGIYNFSTITVEDGESLPQFDVELS